MRIDKRLDNFYMLENTRYSRYSAVMNFGVPRRITLNMGALHVMYADAVLL